MPHFYANQEYASILSFSVFCDVNAKAAVQEYQRRFPNRRTPDRNTFENVLRILRETGHSPQPHPEHDSELPPQEVLDAVAADPKTSTRRISNEMGVPKTTVCKILHSEG